MPLSMRRRLCCPLPPARSAPLRGLARRKRRWRDGGQGACEVGGIGLRELGVEEDEGGVLSLPRPCLEEGFEGDVGCGCEEGVVEAEAGVGVGVEGPRVGLVEDEDGAGGQSEEEAPLVKALWLVADEGRRAMDPDLEDDEARVRVVTEAVDDGAVDGEAGRPSGVEEGRHLLSTSQSRGGRRRRSADLQKFARQIRELFLRLRTPLLLRRRRLGLHFDDDRRFGLGL
mmetsp:Transcript_16698/g.54366  ORF Transcript_16698/g.54366 Transcript_16698/m.54366 type:complete len:228 (-) Transcript_16698:464-1147(-)